MAQAVRALSTSLSALSRQANRIACQSTGAKSKARQLRDLFESGMPLGASGSPSGPRNSGLAGRPGKAALD
jgi:hypothetical protein